jgi:hypothetical protein
MDEDCREASTAKFPNGDAGRERRRRMQRVA